MCSGVCIEMGGQGRWAAGAHIGEWECGEGAAGGSVEREPREEGGQIRVKR